jgi:uncharacterized phage protein (TIGR01671 family)
MEIKFRGKYKNGKWVYGAYMKHQNRTPCAVGDSIKETDYNYLILTSGFSDWNMTKPIEMTEVDKNTVGQFIGRKDINGKEIYKGDIVNFEVEGIWQIGYVDFDNCSFMINTGLMTCYRWTEYDVKVVGNIHENKYLLDFDIKEG